MAGLKEWALRGAEARVAEIRAELAEIRRTFPSLGGGRGGRVAIGIAPHEAAEAEADVSGSEAGGGDLITTEFQFLCRMV